MTLRVTLLPIVLTGRFRWRSVRTSCADTRYRACGFAGVQAPGSQPSPPGRGRPLAALLAALPLALGLTGCAVREPSSLPAPVVMSAILCPEPAAPALPQVDGGESFDMLNQYDVFMERDDLMRGHIDALRRTVNCYRAQVQ